MTQTSEISLSMRVAAALLVGAATVGAQAAVVTFDDPVATGATAASGVWYTDRYAPAGFGNATLAGENVLKQSISAADGASSRPGAFSTAFYNTQGRKLDAPAATTSLSIDLFIDSSWTDTSRRYAGLWGTAFNGSGGISAYPIVEYGMGELRVYNTLTGLWISSGVAASSGDWMTLGIDLVGSDWVYSIDGTAVASIGANGSTRIGNVILQGHNTTAGVSYDIHWDNLRFGSAAAVPAPGSLALVGLALLVAGSLRRRH